MVVRLLSLDTKPWCGIYLYINNPINLGKIIPKAIHHRHFNAEHKVSFTRINDIITLHNHLFTQRGTKEKSLTINVDEMTSLLWSIYYYNNDIESYIR